MVPSRIYFPLLSFLAVFGLSQGSKKCGCESSANGASFAVTDYCDCNNYEDYCDTGNPNQAMACLCARGGKKGCSDGNGEYCMNNNQHMYYVCTRNCGGYSGQVDGQCAQCYAGYVYAYWSSYDSLESCQSNWQYSDGGTQGFQCVETNDDVYGTSYVYSHVPSDNYGLQFYGTCNACPGKVKQIVRDEEVYPKS